MFIYVMDFESKKYMEERGYTLLKYNGGSGGINIWVFANKDESYFDNFNIPCIVSDVLTF